jgi:hypothetical protein
MTETRQRWRCTLEELCFKASAKPKDLERWARAGAFGPRWAETTENKWRHIDRMTARRAVLMRILLDAGLNEETAAGLAWFSTPAPERRKRGTVETTKIEFSTGALTATIELGPDDLP